MSLTRADLAIHEAVGHLVAAAEADPAIRDEAKAIAVRLRYAAADLLVLQGERRAS